MPSIVLKVAIVKMPYRCQSSLGFVQKDATTPNIVATTMFGVVAPCWQWCTNRCNNSQQCWDPQCIVGRIQPISLCKPCVMNTRGAKNVGRAVQTDPTLLRYASAITEQKKCWELLAEKFDRFILYATTSNNMQQGVQTDATCNIQQCWELLVNNVASVCTQPYTT